MFINSVCLFIRWLFISFYFTVYWFIMRGVHFRFILRSVHYWWLNWLDRLWRQLLNPWWPQLLIYRLSQWMQFVDIYWCIEWIRARTNESLTEKSEHALALDQLTTDGHFGAHEVSQVSRMKSSDQLDSSGRSKRLCLLAYWSWSSSRLFSM